MLESIFRNVNPFVSSKKNMADDKKITQSNQVAFEQQIATNQLVKVQGYMGDSPVDGYDASNDLIQGSQNGDSFIVGPGEDSVSAKQGDDTVFQSEGEQPGGRYLKPYADSINLGPGHDMAANLDPYDRVIGGSGSDFYEIDLTKPALDRFRLFGVSLTPPRIPLHIKDESSEYYNAAQINVSSYDELALYKLKDENGQVGVFREGQRLNINGVHHVDINVVDQGKQVDESLNLRAGDGRPWLNGTASENHYYIRTNQTDIPR